MMGSKAITSSLFYETLRLRGLSHLKYSLSPIRAPEPLISSCCSKFTTHVTNEATPLTRQTTPSIIVNQPWRIVAAVCVQRLPLLSREKTELELRVEAMKDTLRAEKSRLSDFELEESENQRLKRQREKRALEGDVGNIQTSKGKSIEEFDELQESRDAELSAFKPAPRETVADKNHDLKSLQRKLSEVLYLLVKKNRAKHVWQMPQGGVEQNESILEASSRELAEECGSNLQVKFLSGSPFAYLSYKHTGREGVLGSKVFFIKANYMSGEVKLNQDELVDYIWVTKEEMKDYVSQELYDCVSIALPA